jgi:hypothetical protein
MGIRCSTTIYSILNGRRKLESEFGDKIMMRAK